MPTSLTGVRPHAGLLTPEPWCGSVRPARVLFSVQPVSLVASRSQHPCRKAASAAPLPSPPVSPPGAQSREPPHGPLFVGVASPPSRDEPVSACYTVATTSKICTARASSSVCTLPSPARARPPTTHRVGGLVTQVSAIHFPRPAIRQVCCNTLLSGCQPPWPPPCCPYRDRTFAPCPVSGHLSPSEVRSSLRPMLTTGRPLARARHAPCSRHGAHTFQVCWHAHILSTASSCARAAVLRDISAGTSYQTVRLVFRPYAHVLPSS